MKNSLIEQYEDLVNSYVTNKNVPTLEERFELINYVAEKYYKETGDTLPQHLLVKLADWTLLEILSDRDIDKVAKTEYAFLSNKQIKRRDNRELSVKAEVLDFFEQKFTKNLSSLSKTNTKEIKESN